MRGSFRVVVSGGSAGGSFEEAGGAGEREPEKRDVPAARGDRERSRCGDPQAQAMEAVHQRAELPGPEPQPEPHHRVPRPVLLREQVGDAPRRERREHEAAVEAGPGHAPRLPPRRHSRVTEWSHSSTTARISASEAATVSVATDADTS